MMAPSTFPAIVCEAAEISEPACLQKLDHEVVNDGRVWVEGSVFLTNEIHVAMTVLNSLQPLE